MCTIRGLAQLVTFHFELGLLLTFSQPMIPCEQSFLSSMNFSVNIVVRVAYLLCSWFVYTL